MGDQVNSGNVHDLESVVAKFTDGARLQDILDALDEALPRRTLQYRLKKLVGSGRLRRTGASRGVRYFTTEIEQTDQVDNVDPNGPTIFPFSDAARALLPLLRRPQIQRKPVGYRFEFLDGYRPNISSYLSATEQRHLAEICKGMPAEPAGTYARQILNRLLIDLSWNSSRLEGNTYSLLDTRRLIHFGAEADGKARLEKQMIINHKEAIEFLVDDAAGIEFNRYTLLNLHALLSNNLLPDPQASGRLRTISVGIGIGKSVYQPLAVPQLIAEYFDQFLTTAQAIKHPHEQALFALVQLPYLQAFDDVNKRVSRLAANIPLIQHNLIPLSFTDVPQKTYIEAVVAIYELNKVDLMKEVFIWACERSVDHYRSVRQTLGEPDDFVLRYREELKIVVAEVVMQLLNRRAAYQHIMQWSRSHIPTENQ